MGQVLLKKWFCCYLEQRITYCSDIRCCYVSIDYITVRLLSSFGDSTGIVVSTGSTCVFLISQYRSRVFNSHPKSPGSQRLGHARTDAPKLGRPEVQFQYTSKPPGVLMYEPLHLRSIHDRFAVCCLAVSPGRIESIV